MDPASAVLHYAQETFEGMKAYRRDDGSVWTFRPEKNAERMVRSSHRLAFPVLEPDDFVAAVDALVTTDQRWVPDAAGEKSLYIRPFMIASEVFLGVRPAQHVTFMVIASPAGAYFKGGVKPVTLWLTEEYTRAGRGGMGAAKTGGNYASSLVAQQEATQHGCDQVVFLDAQEGQYVEELGGMNMYFVFEDGHIVTPETGTILEGITRVVGHRHRRQARPPGRGAQVLHRRVARRRDQRRDHRDLRLRYGGRGHPGRQPQVGRRRGARTGVDRPDDADPAVARRHPVRPRRRHVRLDAPGRLRGSDRSGRVAVSAGRRLVTNCMSGRDLLPLGTKPQRRSVSDPGRQPHR